MPFETTTDVYFFSGYDRWSGKPNAVRTTWRNNHLIELEQVDAIPDEAVPIRLKKKTLKQLIAGEGVYNQPWFLARPPST